MDLLLTSNNEHLLQQKHKFVQHDTLPEASVHSIKESPQLTSGGALMRDSTYPLLEGELYLRLCSARINFEDVLGQD